MRSRARNTESSHIQIKMRVYRNRRVLHCNEISVRGSQIINKLLINVFRVCGDLIELDLLLFDCVKANKYLIQIYLLFNFSLSQIL